MENIPPSPIQLETWPQVIGFLALLAFLGFVYWTNRTQMKSVQNLEKTLTTNNGGSHVKDQLDRLEKGVSGIYPRLEALEAASTGMPSDTETE